MSREYEQIQRNSVEPKTFDASSYVESVNDTISTATVTVDTPLTVSSPIIDTTNHLITVNVSANNAEVGDYDITFTWTLVNNSQASVPRTRTISVVEKAR